ncbi:hypothetical protein [Falsiroseomonas oryzae]|uniref:hypothetical protein n=1 Tax=Falsiroseomonas oryzae TaxID=2766473 RepID=UPI0022EAF246|nr:hypothetical protein [Roseomonas sp. MO-31]
MPFDLAAPRAAPVDAAEFHGVPRALLARHALDRIAPSLRPAVAEIALEEAPPMVNLGLNLDRVAWRAVWRRPGLPEASGIIPVWRGEIA